jgi:hypothetical protein
MTPKVVVRPTNVRAAGPDGTESPQHSCWLGTVLVRETDLDFPPADPLHLHHGR